jgi:diadenosine tetraphosphate (Ap4A) HIT family hydrolase
MWALVEEATTLLDNKFHPDGYNLGANVGEMAGQTIEHAHLHLIPRYRGDVEKPRGGVRGVIPAKQQYEQQT